MKRILKITASVVGCIGLLYLGLVVYVKLYGSGSPLFMDYRYNALITKPMAKMGFVDAQYKMGLFYLATGEVEPTEDELEQAIYWFSKAAEQGYTEAQYELGSCYLATQDYEQAVRWFDKAAEQGNAEAEQQLLKAEEMQRQTNEKYENKAFLKQYYQQYWEFYDSMIDDSILQQEVDYIQSFHFDTMKYNSISAIEKELYRLLESCSAWMYPWRQDLVDDRFRYHLNNPLTFTEDMPILDSAMHIIFTPDRKYKFYSYNVYLGGTMDDGRNFFQYRDTSGRVVYKSWPEGSHNWSEDPPKLIRNIWQFNYRDKNYYVIKSWAKGSSCMWWYLMEIVTIDNGDITYYSTRDIPNSVLEDRLLVCDTKDDSQTKEESAEILVCETVKCNDNIDYDFDPRTLTVYAVTDEWNAKRKEWVTTKRSWRLVLP